MALDRTARTIQLEDVSASSGSDADSTEEELSQYLDFYSKENTSKSINPLDILCVLLHCSDMFLQQNIFSKMSMCQFAVPLLLPAGDGPECTFMLWAMRDITKRWRPHTQAENKGFIEENLVQVEMPLLSFVRLGQSKLSKSKILNQVLSPAQQYQDFFIHDNMLGGNISREISNGLVEISWYLPVGRDISVTFPEPVAVTNLRGDIESNWTQFSFLTQVSSAVKSNTVFYFIITPSGKGVSKETSESFKKLFYVLNANKSHIIVKEKRANDAELLKNLQTIIKHFLKESNKKIKLEDLAKTATKLGIKVDENSQECQKAKECATDITKEIQDVAQYKKETMKLQGDLWKQVTKTEKELHRMRNQGDRNTEQYRSHLREELNKLHMMQNQHDLPDSMSKFISSITCLSKAEKHYFLKWMKFDLDTLTRNHLSMLKAKYKEMYNNKDSNQKKLKQLDQQISDSSLGVEHFLREMGQFYEAECSMVSQGKLKPDKTKFCNLPGVAADLLLDGFPLELIDGDASNIPLQWVTDLLHELNKKTGGKCRMRVISVLGVQSTGKSTLLNTMFGLQLPVASGRCIRGAFMTLIKVKEDLKQNLGCDFIIVTDTQGFKAPELASLEDSYEHDNELATLVVGLSDITIINMTMDNTTEMKDTLQTVVHACLRMNNIMKKLNCQFVHQNVSDVVAHELNTRSVNKFLEQLDEMTRAAANMECKNGITKFSDIMYYNLERDNWYIPGLWYGVPPMASVNSGYSENVYELKKYLFKFMEKRESLPESQHIIQFIEWMKSLWNSVKHENFIISFRNSREAEDYDQLTMKYSQWEWKFRKQVHTWLISTKNTIKNQSADELQSKIRCTDLKQSLICLLGKQEKMMLDSLKQYLESTFDNVHLIEKYRADFSRRVQFLQSKLQSSATAKIDEIIILQKGIDQIMYTVNGCQRTIQIKVSFLLEQVRERKSHYGDVEIEKEFENMWASSIAELPKNLLEKRSVTKEMLLELKRDLVVKENSLQAKYLCIEQLDGFGKSEFQIKRQHVGGSFLARFIEMNSKEINFKTENLAYYLIIKCLKYVTKKVNTGGDYDQTYCQELLNMINERLSEEDVKKLHITHQFELDLKLHIFGNAASSFQMMHERFIQENDPLSYLEKLKSHYWEIVHNIYEGKDETQSRAKQFCELCLKPAITHRIYEHLGKDIVDNIVYKQNSKELSSRRLFQSHWFVKQYILKTYAKGLSELQTKILSDICKKIRTIFEKLEDIPTLSDFLKTFCETMKSELVISQMELQLVSFQNKTDVRQFTKEMGFFLKETEEQIRSEIESSTTESVLAKLTLKPEDELFDRLFGCGKQCPLCGVPCEAGGTDHNEHFASVHRPQGLYRNEKWDKLRIHICLFDAFHCNSFMLDPKIRTSNYWKYIFVKYHNDFAMEYNAEPADIPDDWYRITMENALDSLKKTYVT
ncbi:hypothetical protein XELAEV_18001542mg [Xenopus laevis]|nr:hypothetical protein XELAEV_18001542mg [Xenopus laevis]